MIHETNIVLTENVNLDGTFIVSEDTYIDGNGYSLARNNNATLSRTRSVAEPYAGSAFTVKANQTLELTNIVVDGGMTQW